MECELCSGTGYEPCDNCGEHDCGLNGNRVCVIDGEEYGASPCGQGCTPPHGLDPDYALGESHTAVYEMDMGLLTDGTLADLGRRLDLVLRIAAQMKEARDALETALIEMMPKTPSRWTASESCANGQPVQRGSLAARPACARTSPTPSRRNWRPTS